jgi:ectoine hydroxylase-related dioxygenase (phytanoyl-CoA dioxygenase family)
VFSSHFFCKPAGDGKSVPWHQDAYFWRETIDPAAQAVTVWLAIDPSTRENGCMRVIPGSHRGNASRYRDVDREESVFDEELDPSQVDESRAVPVELGPNQCSVHSGALVHGSHANTSPLRRCAFTMRYMPTTVRFNHEELGHKHQVFLARGVDRAGNTYADPARPHPHLVENRGSGQRFLGDRSRSAG